MLLTEYEYFQCFSIYITKNMNTFNVLTITLTYVLTYLKSTKSTKFLTRLKSVKSVIWE